MDASEEIRRLRSYINDLVSLLALPAIWGGRKLPEVLGILLDALLRMLGLDFIYVRLNVASGAPIEACRIARRRKSTGESQTRKLCRALGQHLTPDNPSGSHTIPNPIGRGEVSIAHVWLELDEEAGVVVAGSRRTDFPTDPESLLLRVSVNQAIIELQRREVLATHQWAAEIEGLKDQLHAENIYLREETEQRWGEIVGRCTPLKKALKLVEQVAPTNACVLIQGETGTGKELIARAVHRLSDRNERAFAKLNCAAIPTGLLEAELFGHEKGAFTGAVAQKRGRFELADRGTIFLDEVGEIPLELQTKLLRVLQEQEFERLGGTRTLKVDVRLVAASNRDLSQMVQDRTFRSDLYYRLKVFPITVPPLRDRTGDIPLLVRHFAQHHARQLNRPFLSIPEETMAAFRLYSWPGNVRELENFIERSVILSQGSTLEAPLGELQDSNSKTQTPATLEDIEREFILRALGESNWVVAGPSGAAEKLGMKRTSLQYKMQKLGINRPH